MASPTPTPAAPALSAADSSDDIIGWTGNLTLGTDTDHAQCVVVELVGDNTTGNTTQCPPNPTDAKCCQFLMDGDDPRQQR